MSALSRRVDFGSATTQPTRRSEIPRSKFEVIPNPGVLIEGSSNRFLPIRRAHIHLNATGVLTNSLTDRPVLGWMADGIGANTPRSTQELGQISLPTHRFGAETTTHIEWQGTLPSRAHSHDKFFYFEAPTKVHDGTGGVVQLSLAIVESPIPDQWSWFVMAIQGQEMPKILAGKGTLVFDSATGRLVAGHSGRVGLLWADLHRPAVGISFDFTSIIQNREKLSDLRCMVIDGKPGVAVLDYRIERDGGVFIRLTNGTERLIAQLAIASEDGRLTGGSVSVRAVR
ncbi:MAG: hypothetical protein KF812_01180 [Fimbriimonadaceae bacterium]|nr:hypothetical protein [Fimbriimonadaceae bacterium]